MIRLVQVLDDPEPCRMRNRGGSEYGTCSCERPTDCPDPPLFTPVGMIMAAVLDQYVARLEEIAQGGLDATL